MIKNLLKLYIIDTNIITACIIKKKQYININSPEHTSYLIKQIFI